MPHNSQKDTRKQLMQSSTVIIWMTTSTVASRSPSQSNWSRKSSPFTEQEVSRYEISSRVPERCLSLFRRSFDLWRTSVKPARTNVRHQFHLRWHHYRRADWCRTSARLRTQALTTLDLSPWQLDVTTRRDMVFYSPAWAQELCILKSRLRCQRMLQSWPSGASVRGAVIPPTSTPTTAPTSKVLIGSWSEQWKTLTKTSWRPLRLADHSSGTLTHHWHPTWGEVGSDW